MSQVSWVLSWGWVRCFQAFCFVLSSAPVVFTGFFAPVSTSSPVRCEDIAFSRCMADARVVSRTLARLRTSPKPMSRLWYCHHFCGFSLIQSWVFRNQDWVAAFTDFADSLKDQWAFLFYWRISVFSGVVSEVVGTSTVPPPISDAPLFQEVDSEWELSSLLLLEVVTSGTTRSQVSWVLSWGWAQCFQAFFFVLSSAPVVFTGVFCFSPSSPVRCEDIAFSRFMVNACIVSRNLARLRTSPKPMSRLGYCHQFCGFSLIQSWAFRNQDWVTAFTDFADSLKDQWAFLFYWRISVFSGVVSEVIGTSAVPPPISDAPLFQEVDSEWGLSSLLLFEVMTSVTTRSWFWYTPF